MIEVEVSTRAREAVGRSSKFAAREVQLVVEILGMILVRDKERVVNVHQANPEGKGRRVVICKRKRGSVHLGSALLPKKGVARSVGSLDIFLQERQGLVDPNGKTEMRNAAHNGRYSTS